MSAIWGILRFDGAGVAESDIDRMGAAMAARCGDGSATFLDGPIGFGHGLMCADDFKAKVAPEAIRGDPRRSEAIRGDPRRSEAIRGDLTLAAPAVKRGVHSPEKRSPKPDQ